MTLRTPAVTTSTVTYLGLTQPPPLRGGRERERGRVGERTAHHQETHRSSKILGTLWRIVLYCSCLEELMVVECDHNAWRVRECIRFGINICWQSLMVVPDQPVTHSPHALAETVRDSQLYSCSCLKCYRWWCRMVALPGTTRWLFHLCHSFSQATEMLYGPSPLWIPIPEGSNWRIPVPTWFPVPPFPL